MKLEYRTKQSPLRLIKLVLLALSLGALLSLISGVFAQNTGENWQDPINISQSAGANSPRIVVDSLGRSHVIWTYSSNSFVYSRENESGWSQPELVELPFGTRRYNLALRETEQTPLYIPLLFADPEGNIHALWRDDEATLFQSRVAADEFGVFEAWSVPQQLAEAALDMNLEFSDTGLMHLVYIRPLESPQFPAGIYYRQSIDDGAAWSAPIPLYQSPYFQSLDAGRANVQITTTETDQLVVSWEDPIQEKLFVIHSADSGGTWDPVIEVDGRQETDGTDSYGPGQLTMASSQNAVHLMWQAGHQGDNCEIYHQMSPNGGETWLPQQEVLGLISDCANKLWLVDDPSGNLLLIDETEGGTYVAVWDGQEWSEPSIEGAITSYVNPVTFREIELACKQPVIAGVGTEASPYRISVLGCESQPNRDIWLRTAELISLVERIAPSVEPVWQPAELLTTAGSIDGLVMAGDSVGQLHAFWSQQNLETSSSDSIYYGGWDGMSWSSVREIFSSPNGLSSVKPSVIFDSPNKLSAVWVEGDPGEILFSQSTAANASAPAEWAVPINLPLPRAAATNPSIARDRNGSLYVAYAVPLNEDRGIYVTTSVDGGDNWHEPVRVFNAVESSWDMVDDPELTIGGDGTLHLMWIRYGSPPLGIPLSIHYSESTNGGLTWSEPDEVALGKILWGEPLAIGDRLIHRLWYVEGDGIWNEISIDSGLTWGQLQRLPGSQEVAFPLDTTLDPAGRPHVVAIGSNQKLGRSQGNLVRHWIWSDDRWVIEENLDVAGSGVRSLASTVTVDGKLVVLYSGPSEEVANDIGLMDIYGSSRVLHLPSILSTPLPTFTPQPPPQVTARPTQTPAPTPTVFFPIEQNEDGGLSLPIDTSSPFVGPLVGVIPAIIVIVVAFFVVVRIIRGDRR